MLEWGGRGAARLPLVQPWGSFCGWSPTAVVVQPVARPLIPLVPLVPSSRLFFLVYWMLHQRRKHQAERPQPNGTEGLWD